MYLTLKTKFLLHRKDTASPLQNLAIRSGWENNR